MVFNFDTFQLQQLSMFIREIYTEENYSTISHALLRICHKSYSRGLVHRRSMLDAMMVKGVGHIRKFVLRPETTLTGFDNFD